MRVFCVRGPMRQGAEMKGEPAVALASTVSTPFTVLVTVYVCTMCPPVVLASPVIWLKNSLPPPTQAAVPGALQGAVLLGTATLGTVWVVKRKV